MCSKGRTVVTTLLAGKKADVRELTKLAVKGFKNYACSLTRRIIGHAHSLATRAGRPWRYLSSPNISKEEVVRQILEQDPVQHGLVAILRCVEPCETYEIRPQSEGGKTQMKPFLTDAKGFRVFRRPQGLADQPKKWRALQRGLAYLDRRAEVSKAANQRYLLALSAVEEKTPLRQLAATLCRPLRRKGRYYRALNPWSPTDGALLEVISRGEFVLNGLRNPARRSRNRMTFQEE